MSSGTKTRDEAQGELEALREQRDLLNSIIEGTDDLVFAKDLEGRYVLMNSADAKGFGRSVEEVVGLTDRDLFPPDQAEQIMETDRRIIATGKSMAYEQSFGGPVHGGQTYLVSKYPRFDQDQSVIGILGIARDITDRKRVEESLMIRDRAIAASINAIAMTDQDAKLAYVNQAFVDLWGYDHENEVLGRPATEFWQVEGRAAQIAAALRGTGGWIGELTGRKKDGSSFEVQISASAVTDDAGELICMMASFVDITERKRTEEALRHSEAEKSLILNATSEMIVYQDTQHTIIWANQAGATSVAQEREDLVGRKCYEIWHQRQTPCEICPVARALETGKTTQGEVVTPDGRVWLIRGTPIRDESGAIIGTIEVTAEITDRKRAEEALRKSEARFRGILENTAHGIALVDTTGHFVHVNAGWAEMLHYTPDELTQMSASEITHPQDMEESRRKNRALFAGQIDFFRIEKRYIRKDGTALWADLSVRPLRDPAGHIAGAVGILVDITERKRAEEELRESEERFRQIAENSNQVFWLTDWRRKELLYVNPSYETIFGRTMDSLYQDRRSWLDVVHPEDRSRMDEIFAVKGERGECADEEYRIVRPDGDVRWIRDRSLPIRDESGSVYRYVGIAEDITARKQVEEALIRSERDYRGLFENAHDAILIFRPDDEVVLDVNARASAMYGLDRSEFVGMSLESVSRNVTRGKGYIRELLEKGARHGFETVQSRKDGSEMHLEINSAVVEYHGQRAILTINRDITERKRAQEELVRYRDHLEELVERRTHELDASREQLRRSERLASVGTLAAGIAHEINNPVGMILLAAENAKTYTKAPNEQHLLEKCLDNIVSSAERCGHITDSVLQFASKQTTEKAAVDLNSIIEHAVLLTRKYAKQHGGAIDLQLADALPQIFANRVEMEQVLVNLIQNAVEAAAGGVRIVIRTRPTPGGLRIVVEDNGPGVAQDELKHLFDPFFTTRREMGGTGLGLSIVHGIITGHGGTIGVESRLRVGTTFTIELPVSSLRDAETVNVESTDC